MSARIEGIKERLQFFSRMVHFAFYEMHNATRDKILHAKSVCEDTIRMREKGSVDYAYSQMNLALAERQCIKFMAEPDRALSYSNVLKSYDRGFRVFKSKSEFSSFVKSTYHSSILETLMDWLNYETEKSKISMYEKCIPADVDIDTEFELPKFLFVSMLKSNPATLGYDRTPDWVPSARDILEDAIKRMAGFDNRRKKAEDFLRCSTGTNNLVALKLFQLRSMLVPLLGVPSPPLDAMDRIWAEGDIEQYFVYASSILTWDSAESSMSEERYLVLLRRIKDCLFAFRSSWSHDDIERLLLRNPLTFRLAGCSLARIGLWREAYVVLEASRGLVSSSTCDTDPMFYDQVNDEATWVHVTHDPVASYVIIRTGDTYIGKVFRSLSGKKLTAHFMNLSRPGLLSARNFNRESAIHASTEVAELLVPLCDWINEHSSGCVVLIPGGYYQAFPLWACGQLGEALLAGKKTVTSVPSRTVAFHNKRSDRPRAMHLSVQAATDVPGHDPLRWSRCEPTALEAILKGTFEVEVEDATTQGLASAIRRSGAAHYTGHSQANREPLDSAVATYGGDLAVREILQLDSDSSLVTFDSCESGLARNATRQDEMLSIQSAAYYAGAEMVVGTSWPIMDPVGFAFTVKFYGALERACAGQSGVSPSSVTSAYAEALSWMRNATVSDLKALSVEYDASLDIADSSSSAFTFFDWAAFGIVGVPFQNWNKY